MQNNTYWVRSETFDTYQSYCFCLVYYRVRGSLSLDWGWKNNRLGLHQGLLYEEGQAAETSYWVRAALILLAWNTIVTAQHNRVLRVNIGLNWFGLPVLLHTVGQTSQTEHTGCPIINLCDISLQTCQRCAPNFNVFSPPNGSTVDLRNVYRLGLMAVPVPSQLCEMQQVYFHGLLWVDVSSDCLPLFPLSSFTEIGFRGLSRV